MDGFLAFTIDPLKLPLYFGFLSFMISLVMFIIMIINAFSVSNLYILITLILFITSLLFSFIGIIGLYLSKTYLESKNRPLYIIKETNRK